MAFRGSGHYQKSHHHKHDWVFPQTQRHFSGTHQQPFIVKLWKSGSCSALWHAFLIVSPFNFIDFIQKITEIINIGKRKVHSQINLCNCLPFYCKHWHMNSKNKHFMKGTEANRKSTLNIHWKDWCWKWSSNTLAICCEEPTHWKDLDAGKYWGQEEKETENEMVGWDHWLKKYEFEETPGDNEGQGSLACCSSWGCKEWNMT